jgi:diguanylate cyclase (GGDEF)-like protein/PAS domain S-box-containing protein
LNAQLTLAFGGLALLIVAAAGLFRLMRLRDAWIARALVQKRYSVLESIPDAFFILDGQMRFSHVNERAEALLRRGAVELIGTRIVDVLDPLASELVPDMRRARTLGAPIERLQYFASTNLWIEIRIQPAQDELLVYLRDVTKDKNAELRLSANERRFRVLLSQVPAVIWTVDLDLRVTSVAGAALNERGLSEDRLLGAPFESLLGEYEEKDACAAAVARAFRGETVRYETRHGDRWMQNDVEPLRDPQGDIVGAIGVMLDVTEMRENAERFSKLARQDALTGLPNRMALGERLPAMIEEAVKRGESLAVLFVDVDRFKTINDTLGHRAGDELLKSIANRLNGLLDERSMIFRPGGDEFVVVVGGIAQRHNAALLAANLINAFGEPFSIAGRDLFVSASVGGSMFPQDAQTAEELIAFADSAMYRSKEAGGSTARLYDGASQTHVLERLGLEQDLRQALGRNELNLLFQPIVDLKSKRIVAAEALLRWQHPMLGELLPNIFIPIAEETGIITELSRWVLREACSRAARIRATELPDFRVAVNLSPKDLYDVDFVAMLASLLKETGLRADALDVEITESVMVNEVAIATLTRMSRMGVGIIVDDFGTGYSSLGYIKRLPVTALKIDKGFIDDVVLDSYDQGIVKTISTLGQTLGLRVIAEGVESEQQYEFVRSVDCEQAQGFFFSRPVPYATLVDVLRHTSGRQTLGSRVVSLHA